MLLLSNLWYLVTDVKLIENSLLLWDSNLGPPHHHICEWPAFNSLSHPVCLVIAECALIRFQI